MKAIKKLIIFTFIIFIMTGCSTTKETYLKEISYNEYHNLLDNNETFILEIMRTECSACISYKPIIKKVSDDYEIEIKYINTDHLSDEEKEKLYDETGIEGTPTVFFYINGKEETVASRLNGSVSYEKTVSKFKASGFIDE